MTEDQFKGLNQGDLIRPVFARDRQCIVTAHYGTHITTVETMEATNPEEWEIIAKAYYRLEP